MELSDDIISEFVKATKDEKTTKNETIVYGTVVENDGSKYVKLDGSESLTPVLSTADAKNGERVTVVIKNHTAIITGNISSPAARSGDVWDVSTVVASVEELQKGMTEVEKSTSDNADNIVILQKHVMNLQIDYVIERGTKDIWTYEKWNSGKLICWGNYSGSSIDASTNTLDGLYHSDPISVAFPVSFTGKPVVQVNGGDSTHMHFIREFGSTTTNAIFVIVCNDASQISVNIEVPIYAIGSYK